MRKVRFICVGRAALLGLFFMNPAMAQDSKGYAVMAKAAWSAFECSSLASKINNPKEQERLFLYGYDQGQKFIAALKEGKIKKEDLSTGVPMMMLLLLEGPTSDFMLGRIFEAAQDSALGEVYKTGDNYNSEEMQKTIANNKFWKSNCQLIGKN